ncbi:MAG: Na+/H+ antiporter NhaC family protein [Sphaerochaetaceae bacterium]|jgi:Na+/H+ antiporter NhaC
MFGIWSIVPPLAAIILAIVSRKVVISLFVSVFIGGMIFSGGNPFAATAVTFTWMKDVMVDSWNARFLVLVALLGIGAALMFKVGGSHALSRALRHKINNKRKAQLFAWFLGVIVFFNDYVNSVIAGNASKDITGEYRVSREKLAYILDATAAPMATIGPVSDWIGYQVSLIAAAFAAISFTGSQPYFAFLNSIQWNFYSVLSLVIVPLIIFEGDFGLMAKAELRALKTGKLIEDGAVPLSSVEMDLGEPIRAEKANVWFFILPLVTLIGVGIWALWYTGGGPEGKNMMDALADTEVDIALTWAAFAMVVVGVILAFIQKFTMKDLEDTIMGGIRTMLPALVIMILAWAIGEVTDALGTADFVVQTTASWMSPALLPFIIFLICMFISFSTGTSWGTMAIMTPIGIPLAYTIGGLPMIHIIIGAIFAGAIFGDHCSPISDTSVMASIFAGSDHIAHVKTQIPYAVIVAVISAFLYLLSSFITKGWVLMLLGIVILVVAVKVLSLLYNRANFTEEERALLKQKEAYFSE